ncbi:MAG: hypothetical protein WCL21_17675 [Mariniphaga sp.]
MKKSFIQTILANFAAMDTENLRLFLKDEYTYQDTTKELFLNEIASIFEVLINSGDTELIIYRGKCGGITCENCGKQGYRFVGNKSKNYLDLIFEMNGDDITDIYYCDKFNTDDETDELGTKADFYINPDDQVSFDSTPEYWSKVYAATTAWSEIITNPPRQICFDELCYWVDKNAVADSLIGSYEVFDATMKWTPFSEMYADLKEVRSYISNHIEKFKLANLKGNQIRTEQDLLDWIVNYEEIHEEASIIIKHCFVKGNGNFSLYPKNPILFNDSIFEETFSFFKFFQDHFNNIFIKYSTNTDEENSNLYNMAKNMKEANTFYSLKYHLAIRKASAEKGFVLPYYPDNISSNN